MRTSEQSAPAVLECRAHYERDRTLLEVYLASAARHAGRTAVVTGDEAVTYSQLSARAAAVARALQGAGVRPGDAVGLLLDRGVEVPTAMLAVLACGGVFVPLDPQAPAGWNAAMVARARCRVVVTNGPAAPPGVTALHCSGAATDGVMPAAPARTPTDPVGVMFTSGSTGEPKGVVIPNRAIVRLCRGNWFLDAGPGCRVLHASPLAFDASTLELWGPLLNGGTVVVAPPGGLGIGELDRLIAEKEITACWLTASLFHACVQARPEMFSPLRTVLTGGDVVSPKCAATLRTRFPDLRIVNGYGPTENTTFTTCHEVRGVDPDRPLPIGTPIANSGVCVVDDRLGPLGFGEPGELVATGDGLALGYLDDPEATSAAFVDLPLLGRRGYRTGDRALIREDGVVEYLGRLDRQVKIRGFRVNPATTEAALLRQPGVREAAVVVPRSPDGSALCAVVTTDPTDSWPDMRARLLAALREELPEYLVPQTLAHRASLPRSATGKLDRNAIRAGLESGVLVTEEWRAWLPGAAERPSLWLATVAVLLQEAWAPGERVSVRVETADLATQVELEPIVGQSAAQISLTIESQLRGDLAETGPMRVALRDPEGREARLLADGDLRLALHPDTTDRVRDWRVHHARAALRFAATDQVVGPETLVVIADDERRQIEEVWNDTAWDHGITEPLTVLFERQAALRPDDEAIRSDDLALSFRQVLHRSNAVANRLLSEGRAPGSRVAYYDTRTVDSIIATIGVLRAGMVCVPLDPHAPASRLEAMLEDAGVGLFLRNGRDPSPPRTGAGLRTVEFARHEDPTPPGAFYGLGGEAIVLFTSGSTGRSKAVPIRHDSLVNVIAWIHRRFGLTRDDVILQRSRLSWDGSVWEYLWPLAFGGRCFVADGTMGDPSRLYECIRVNHVTMMLIVPTLAGPLAKAARHFGPLHLRVTLFGGEALSSALAREYVDTVGGQLQNTYGPTEAILAATDVRYESSGAGVTIGRPAENTRIEVVNAAGLPVPVGVPGEIWISGVQVSHGYSGPPNAESGRFLTRSGDWPTYRTGDVARWREDGCLEFLGRADSQVKINGIRIELGEIETALLRREDIAEAVVCKVGEGLTASLVAVCVPDARSPGVPDSHAVLADLRETLESFAVPSRVVWMDAIPRLPNGKADRRRLAASVETRGETPETGQSPAEVVRSMWKAVLGVEPTADDEHFMAEGGNSLSFLRLMLGIEERLGIEVPAAPALSEPTLGRVTALVESLLHQTAEPGEHGRHAEAERAAPGTLIRLTYGAIPLIMLPHLGGTVGFLREIAPHFEGRVALYGIRPRGLFEGEPPLDRIEDIADGYAELIASRGWGAVALAGFSSGAIISVSLARRLLKRGIRVPALVVVDSGPGATAAGRWRRAAKGVLLGLPRLIGMKAPAHRYGEHVTETQRRLMETHLRAMFRHRMLPYDGPSLVVASPDNGPLGRLSAWRKVLRGPAAEVLVNASHMEMWRGEHAPRMAQLLLDHVTAAFERDAASMTDAD